MKFCALSSTKIGATPREARLIEKHMRGLHTLLAIVAERALSEDISPQFGHHRDLRSQLRRHDRLVGPFSSVAHVEGVADDRLSQPR